jgi:hypothetical protein
MFFLHAQQDSVPTLFSPVAGANYRAMTQSGEDSKAYAQAFRKLGKAWDAVTEIKKKAKKMGSKPQPVPLGVDDLLQVYGSQEEVDTVCTPRQPGDLQLKHPIHVHRAPPPPPPGSKTYRRSIFVSWDHGKVINAP